MEKNNKNLVAVTLGVLSTLIISNYLQIPQHAQRMVSPLSASIMGFGHQQQFMPKRFFAFAPGWSLYNLDRINFNGIEMISYYDVPADDVTGLNKENTGYDIVYGDRFSQLVQAAHQTDTKITITIGQTSNQVITNLISNDEAQNNLAKELQQLKEKQGIDGVVVGFEFAGEASPRLRQQYASFISKLSSSMKQKYPDFSISVAVPNNTSRNSLYDLPSLASSADAVLVTAYDYAVPELGSNTPSAPLFGYASNEYWSRVQGSLQKFVSEVPSEKIALEAAWYGDGNHFPFYGSPQGSQPSHRMKSANTLKTPLSNTALDALVSGVPLGSRIAARKNLPIIAKALEREGILNERVLAYALATIEHETAGTFEPIEEIQGRRSARRLGYEGGTDYFGRGFIQLTHLRNYRSMGERIGVGDKLVKNPELALNPEISARILAAFFKENGVAQLASQGAFIDARQPINPDYQGVFIADMAYKYLDEII